MKTQKYAIALSTLLLSSTVFAGGDTGIYIGVGAGGYNTDIKESELTNIGTTNDFKSSGTAGKLIAGYNFGIIPLVEVAVEANYVVLQEAEEKKVKMDGNAINGFGLVGINLGSLGLFGKAGMSNYSLKVKNNSSKTLSDSAPVYGLGARFELFGVRLRAEYELYDIQDIKLDTTTASITYTF